MHRWRRRHRRGTGTRLTARTLSRLPVTGWLTVQQLAFFGVAAWIGIGLDLWQAKHFLPTPAALGLGGGAAILLIALMQVMERALPRTSGQLDADLLRIWAAIPIVWKPSTIVVLSCAAGLGEEALFRGALQLFLTQHLPVAAALILTAVVFGLAHAATLRYFVATAVMGLLLGALFHYSTSLLTVMLAHAGYDLWAMRRLQHLLATQPTSQASRSTD